MKCFHCIVECQASLRTKALDAITVYNGKATCFGHLNTQRGLPEDTIVISGNVPGLTSNHIPPIPPHATRTGWWGLWGKP